MHVTPGSPNVNSDDVKRKPKKNSNSVFAVHITDLIPIYAFRAMALT